MSLTRRRTHRTSSFISCVALTRAAVLVLVLGPSAAAAEPRYHVIDLGTLGGTFSGVGSINNKGQIAGTSTLPGSDVVQTVIWENGVMTPLGAPGYKNYPEGINDSGQIAGVYELPGDSRVYSYLYSGGEFIDLGTLGGNFTHTRGMNNLGHVVGDSGLPNFGPQRAFLYQDGQLSDLGTLGGNYSMAGAVNDHGQVIGTAHRINDPGGVAFLYDNGTMINLGTLGGEGSGASDINNHGQIVGTSQISPNGLRAYLYENGQMINLGTIGGANSHASAINNKGQIVGSVRHTQYPTDFRSCLWEDGTIYDLHDLVVESGWNLRLVTDINDQGWIIGGGFNPQGEARGFVLVPIPEPSSAVLCISAVIMLLRRRFSPAMDV